MTKFIQINQQPFSHPQAIFRGSWIDASGREIPITERMIQEACRDLESAANSVYPKNPGYHAIHLPQDHCALSTD